MFSDIIPSVKPAEEGGAADSADYPAEGKNAKQDIKTQKGNLKEIDIKKYAKTFKTKKQIRIQANVTVSGLLFNLF